MHMSNVKELKATETKENVVNVKLGGKKKKEESSSFVTFGDIVQSRDKELLKKFR